MVGIVKVAADPGQSLRCMRFHKTMILFVFLSTAMALAEQMPSIGIIDFYGLRQVSKEQAQQALQIKIGDDPKRVRGESKQVEKRLEAIPGVSRARLSFVCCDAGKAILYVGIEEKGASALQLRPAPQGKVRLPKDVVDADRALDNAMRDAVVKGDTAEDDSHGYALSHNPAARAIEERYITFAARDLNILRDVLHNSADANQRANAAQVIAYAADKRAIVPDLEYAMSDVDGEVRNNAMRALGLISGFAQNHPGLKIRVSPGPFVDMLNSLIWSDRNKSSMALMYLTERRDPALLADLREHAMTSLIEMARWKSTGHAMTSFVILGRIAGLPDKEIFDDWEHGDREKVIAAAMKTAADIRGR